MQDIKHSRRAFLKSSTFLAVSGLISIPSVSIANAALQYSNHISKHHEKERQAKPARSDIRSLDFDSHHFLLNFKY